jgi:rRNA-processing protein FCF1
VAPQPAAELRLILDSGAVIAVAAGKPRVRSRFEEFRDQCIAVIVPAAVIAEVIRGGPGDATVNRFLKTIDEVSAVTERTARRAGALLAAIGSTATVDALVIAEAAFGGRSVVTTGDPNDLRALATGLANVHVEPV